MQINMNKLRDNMEGFLKIEESGRVSSFVGSMIDTIEVIRDLIVGIFYFLFTVFSFFFIMYGFFTAIMSTSADIMSGRVITTTMLAIVYLGFYYVLFRER